MEKEKYFAKYSHKKKMNVIPNYKLHWITKKHLRF